MMSIRDAMAALFLVACASNVCLGGVEWVASSPGTLTVAASTDKTPDGSTAHKITFKPDARRPGYWCSSGIVFDTPRDANSITFYARASVARNLDLKVYDSEGRKGLFSGKVQEDWSLLEYRTERPMRISDGEGPLKDIVRIQFDFNNEQFDAGSIFDLVLSEIKVEKIAPLKFLYPNWMPAKPAAPVKGYRIGTCIHAIWGAGNGDFTKVDDPASNAVARDVIDNLARQYGPFEVTFGRYQNNKKMTRDLADYVRSKGGIPMGETHEGGASEAPAVNINGELSTDRFNGEDQTDGRVMERHRNLMIRSAEYGLESVRVVDLVWPWRGGAIWGYSDSAIKAWQSNLTEFDPGIITVENGKLRPVHFWEYFESYQGYRMKPEDAGLKDWEEYQPPRRTDKESIQLENRSTLFAALFHYEWVKHINEVTRPAVELGLKVQPITNPEGFATGTDLYWLLKGSAVRGASCEWWGGSDIILANYYNGRYYDNVAKKNDHELVLHGETAAAGGYPYPAEYHPHYWDNQANYLITYAQSASVDFKAKHDQYWGSSWKNMTDPNHPEYQSYTGFHSAWTAFLQCRNDKAVKPKADILAMTNRPIFSNTENFDQSAGGQPYNLAKNLNDLNYLHDGGAFPLEDAFKLEDYKTIVHCAADPPKRFVADLAAWVKQGSGRTIITHSFMPTRVVGPATAESMRGQLLRSGGMENEFEIPAVSVGKVRSGLIRSDVPAFASALAPVGEQSVTFTQPLYEVPGGKTLVSLGGRPLVSERPCGKGRIIYLHFVPNNGGIMGRKVERAIMDGVMRYLGHLPEATGDADHRVLSFDRPDGKRAFVSFYTNCRGDAEYKGKTYKVFQAQDPAVKGSMRVRVGEPGKAGASFTLTDMITGTSETAQSDSEGYIPLKLDGWNMRGVYVDPKP